MPDSKTYGGFFPLEIGSVTDTRNASIEHLRFSLNFYNARSAIAELIKVNQIHDVMLPSYICPVVYQTVEKAGAKSRYFTINSDFSFDYTVLSKMAKQETLVILPSYFGVYMPDIDVLIGIMHTTGCRILLDYAQALYEPCPEAFSAIYSPRKFLGVPDGGFLSIGKESRLVPPPQPMIKVSPTVFGERLACHGVRLEYANGSSFDSFGHLEQTMPYGSLRMSELAMSIFTAFDHDAACGIRRRNYNEIASFSADVLLVKLTLLPLLLASIPLCFPLPVHKNIFSHLRSYLISNSVYVPHYWPDLTRTLDDVHNTILALPIDQRYTSDDMSVIVKLIKYSSCLNIRG